VASQWNGKVEFPVELVTANFAEIVAASIEEKVVDEGACIVESDGFTRAQFPIDFQQGFVFGFHGIALLRCLDITDTVIGINCGKGFENALVV
jgi:hypothetical protein